MARHLIDGDLEDLETGLGAAAGKLAGISGTVLGAIEGATSAEATARAAGDAQLDARIDDIVLAEGERFATPVEWDPATVYEPLTIVLDEDVYWKSKRSTTGEKPSDHPGVWATAANNPDPRVDIGALTVTKIVRERPVTYFGADPAAPASVNTQAFLDARNWARDNTLGARRITVPPVGPAQTYDIDDVIDDIPAGTTVLGDGRRSRIRQLTKPKPFFRTTAPGTIFRDLAFIGPADRYLLGGSTVEREWYPFIGYSGVVFQAHSDGGLTENLYGERIACVVAAWAWDEALGAFAGEHIDGLTIKGTVGIDVWAAIAVRETNHLHVDDFAGSYSRPGNPSGGDGSASAPPHLIYLLSTGLVNDLPEGPRYLRNVTVSNGRARDGSSSAFKFDSIDGAELTNMVAENCAGVAWLAGVRNVRASGLRSSRDVTPPTAAIASLNVSHSSDVTVDDVAIDMAAGDRGRPIDITDDCVRVRVRRPETTTRHDTAATSAGSAEVRIDGTDCRVEQPYIRLLGAARLGVRLAGTRPVLTDPRMVGVNRGVFFAGSATAPQLEDYDPDNIELAAASTFSRVTPDTTHTFRPLKLKGTAGRAGVWDGQHVGNGTGRLWDVTSSGHTVSVKVGNVWRITEDRQRIECTATGGTARYAGIDVGTADVEVTSEVTLGAKNDPGSSSDAMAGHLLRYVDADNRMSVELHAGKLVVAYRSGGTRTEIASVARAHKVGRRYVLTSALFGDDLQVFVDGRLVVEQTLDGAALAAVGAGTVHGYFMQFMVAARFRDLRIRPL